MSGDEHDETSLERALRAPGTPAELSEEARYAAMFRAQGPTAGPSPVAAASSGGARRAVRRLGAGSTLAVAFAVASAGVAAAYASSLPDPVQRVFHSVLAPIGVPPAQPQGHARTPQARPTPEPTPPDASAAPAPSSSPETDPAVPPSQLPSEDATPGATDPGSTASPSDGPTTTPSESPTETPSEATASPTTTPTTTPTPTPTPTPTTAPSTTPSPTVTTTPTPTATPASVSIVSAGAGQRVAPGGTAVVTGQVVAADGTPVPDAPVVLQGRGTSGWHRIAVAPTASDGSVSMTTGQIEESTTVRLRSGSVSSAAWRIEVQPTLVVSAQTSGAVTTLSVAASGARAGDTVVLLVRHDGVLDQQARGTLDSAGGARFSVPTPTRTTRYVVRLPATPTHAFASARVAVDPPTTPPPSTPSSAPPSPTASP
jgi:hypothetical protein